MAVAEPRVLMKDPSICRRFPTISAISGFICITENPLLEAPQVEALFVNLKPETDETYGYQKEDNGEPQDHTPSENVVVAALIIGASVVHGAHLYMRPLVNPADAQDQENQDQEQYESPRSVAARHE
jgi:hypothetical protein